MCFDDDSRPPIPPIAGGALDAADLVLTAADGNRFRAFRARPAEPTGAAVIVLPDIRGLHHYYEELALRFAEAGIEAVAIDYFGRTAGVERRPDGWQHTPHVAQTTFAGQAADITAAAAELRSAPGDPPTRVFTVGFCFGGRLSFLCATLGLDLAGVIGFYGVPRGPSRNDMPEPTALADRMQAPVLGLFGGDDPSIPVESIAAFETALAEAGVDHRVVTYPGAPHSFFDRQAEAFESESEAAWQEVLGFIAPGRDVGRNVGRSG
jgi:carboxymethylenebutenolidase